ncbi:Uncharacterised protein [Mycobacterium tuberculosis]|uniref:Uncharacterized protein n=1 Tax=Mycobacterium tuberculosis TaxID=1773 RepID=A0A916PA79_MYCTX|nr:Uncharacterised protein [Mycobacterium tuberculosis]CPA06800.1 Uncharacterised protein [Mycobacterium tuberculosis]CPB58902.1 Uncharacterised protein [Mycobacterium tuberculosis]
MTPRNRSRTSASTPHRRSPSCAIGNNVPNTNSRVVTSPKPGQSNWASMPYLAAARKFACAAAKFICVHNGGSASDRPRSAP